MELKDIKKFTLIINGIILVLVFMLAGFFMYCKATFLIWFSIPTALVYVIGYFLIRKDRLEIYTRVVYFWLTLYMCLCTVFLGYRMGFHLYCMSMIPISFYAEFMADKLGKKKLNAFATSGAVAFCYLVSTGYSAANGAVYEVDTTVRDLVWTMNSVITIFFMIFYSKLVLSMIGDYGFNMQYLEVLSFNFDQKTVTFELTIFGDLSKTPMKKLMFQLSKESQDFRIVANDRERKGAVKS